MADENIDPQEVPETPEKGTPKKVVNKDYLYNQFKIFYEQISKPEIKQIESELIAINVKLDKIITALTDYGIPVDLTDEDEG